MEIRSVGIALSHPQDVGLGQAIIWGCAPSGKGSKLDNALPIFSVLVAVRLSRPLEEFYDQLYGKQLLTPPAGGVSKGGQ